MQSPSRSFMSPTGPANGDAPNLRAVMTAAVDAYLWTERQRAEETGELSLELKKLRIITQECATAAQQRQEEIAQLGNELSGVRDSVTNDLQALREVQAVDTGKLREMLDTSGWKLREQQSDMVKLREAMQMESKTLREEMLRAYAPRNDLQSIRSSLETQLTSQRSELQSLRSELEKAQLCSARNLEMQQNDLLAVSSELQHWRREQCSSMEALKSQLEAVAMEMKAGLTAQQSSMQQETDKVAVVAERLTAECFQLIEKSEKTALQRSQLMTAQLEAVQGEVQRDQRELATLKADFNSSRTEVQQLTQHMALKISAQGTEIAQLRQLHAEAQKMKALSDAQVEQTRSELEALSAEQRGLRTESDMSFAKVGTGLADSQKELAEMRSRLSDLQKELSTCQGRMTSLQQDVSGNQTQSAVLQKEVSNNQSAVAALQKEMLAVENGLTETRQDSLATQTRVNALQKETLDLSSSSSSMRLCLEELRKETMESQAQATQVVELRKAMLEHQSSISELRRDAVKNRDGQADLRQELEKLRGASGELRKDLSLTCQLEVTNLRKDLAQREESINGEVAAAQARMKEQINSDMRKISNEVQHMSQQRHQGEQLLREEVLQLAQALRTAEEEAEELRAEVHEACTAIEEQRQEVDAQLSLRISEVHQSLQAEFKVADATLHTEVATAAANDRYNLGVEMERLRADLGQVELLRSSVAQAQELASRAGSHEVLATLRVEQLFSPAASTCDFEFPLVASRCLVRLKPNRKGESPASTSRSPEGNGFEFWEYMGIFFGLCETKVALGASRLSSYVCAVRLDVFDPQNSAWLPVLSNPAQELTAGGALLGSHEALTMHHFKELTSGIGPERKLLLRVVVSDIGSLRLQQFEDTFPSGP